MAIIKNINAEKIQGRLDVTDVSASYLKVTNGIVASSITANLDYSNVTNKPTLVSSSRQIASQISGSFTRVSGSFATRFDRLSYAITGSNTFTGSQTINGNLLVNGDLTANSFHNIFVSSSTIYTSGSTKFGDTPDDKHQFTGSLELQGGMKVQYGINANWFHGDVDFVHLVNKPRFVSSSIQIGSEISGSFTNISASLASRIAGISTSFNDITNKPTLISSSIQIGSQISGSFTRVSSSFANRIANLTTDNVAEGSHLYYTDTRVQSKINANGVISGSSQVFFGGISNKPVGLVSSSRQLGSDISGSFKLVSASLANRIASISTNFYDITNKPTLLSSSLQIATQISGSFSTVSASLAGRISNISTTWDALQNKPTGIVSSSLQLYNTTLKGMIISGSFSGSYKGDGSGLTGVQTTVVQNATAYDTFTNATSKTVTHNFGTKNVVVSVYDNNDALIIPSSIITTDINTVTLGFAYATTGRAVVAKGGHIVSGSLQDYTHRESISGNTSYTITHNLNEDYPIVQVYSTSKEQVIPSKIKSTSANAVLIEFNSSFSGTVVVKK